MQQDAHELMMFIINTIIEEEKKTLRIKENPENPKSFSEQEKEKKKAKSNIEDLVYGKMAIKRTCKNCGNISKNEDDFSCLYATAPNDGSKKPLNKCFINKKEENIDYHCEKCLTNEAKQSTEITKYPTVLVVCIKKVCIQ